MWFNLSSSQSTDKLLPPLSHYLITTIKKKLSTFLSEYSLSILHNIHHLYNFNSPLICYYHFHHLWNNHNHTWFFIVDPTGSGTTLVKYVGEIFRLRIPFWIIRKTIIVHYFITFRRNIKWRTNKFYFDFINFTILIIAFSDVIVVALICIVVNNIDSTIIVDIEDFVSDDRQENSIKKLLPLGETLSGELISSNSTPSLSPFSLSFQKY